MTGRGQGLLLLLCGIGAALTLFQVWYISLPLEDATAVDICRLGRTVNCLKSLHAFGDDMVPLGIPVFPALCGLFWFMLAATGFAFVAAPARSEALLALARLTSFPASGLAIYVLLHDLTVAKATSASAILVALCGLGIATLTVLQGIGSVRLGRAGWPGAALGGFALLAIFFLHGAVSARRGIDLVTRERAEAAAGVLWPRVAHDLPRKDAAALGRWTAPTEIVLLTDENSGDLLREAAEIMPRYADRVLLVIYARGRRGAELILAQREGILADYLRGTKKPKGDPATVQGLLDRQEAGWPEGIGTLPAALSHGAETRTGRFSLRAFIDEQLAERQ